MRRLFARPDSPRCFRASVEELEVRAQPALLTLAVSAPALVRFETQVSFFNTSATVSLPSQANQHAQIVVAIHTSSNNPPTTPPANPPASNPAPTPTQPPANNTGSTSSSSATPTDSNAAPAISPAGFALLTTLANALPTVASTTVASAVSNGLVSAPLAAVSSLLLPPNLTAPAPDSTALPVGARESALAPAAQSDTPTFPAPAPILYLRELSVRERPELFGNANAPAVYDGVNPLPIGAVPSPATATPADQPQVATEFAPTLPELFPIVVGNEPAVVPVAATASEEAHAEAISPWTWAVTVAGVVAGASWMLHRHLRKPAATAQPVRDWRDYPLGLDIDRL